MTTEGDPEASEFARQWAKGAAIQGEAIEHAIGEVDEKVTLALTSWLRCIQMSMAGPCKGTATDRTMMNKMARRPS